MEVDVGMVDNDIYNNKRDWERFISNLDNILVLHEIEKILKQLNSFKSKLENMEPKNI